MSSTPARTAGWLATMPDRPSAQPREADQDVVGVAALHLEKAAVVHDPPDHVVHVVRLVGAVGDEVEQRFVAPVDRVVGGPLRAARRGC